MVCEACQQNGNTDARFCCHCGKPLNPQSWNRFSTRLVRPREGRMIGGVCAAISEAYGFDPTLVRLLTVLLFFGGFGSVLIAYIAAWIVMPSAPALYVPVMPMGSAPIS